MQPMHKHMPMHACLKVPLLRHAGPEFEKRILVNEKNNAKFNFLNPTDPYHAYYQMRVRAARNLCCGPELCLYAVRAPAAARGCAGGSAGVRALRYWPEHPLHTHV